MAEPWDKKKRRDKKKMKNDELLKANSKNEDYPNTDVERIGYAVYATIRSLEPLSPAIRRLQRCEEMFKLNAPNIIKHHEAEEALKYLAEVKQAIDDAYNETWLIYHSAKEKDD